MRDDIEAEYQRFVAQLPDEPPSPPGTVTARTVLHAHFLVVDFFADSGTGVGGIGPRSIHLLHSAVSRQNAGLGAVRKWKDLFELTATLFYGIIKDHPFHDANKRTALLTALYQLDKGKRTPNVPQKELDTLALRVAGDDLDAYSAYEGFAGKEDCDVHFIARQFRRMTREIDNRHYAITFRELDTILHRFGARLEVAGGNHANIIKSVEEPAGFFATRTKIVERRVGQVGFNDWGTQVLPSDLRRVREILGLTPANGIDAEVFYNNVDPLKALVREYAGPLRRLADK